LLEVFSQSGLRALF